MESCLCLTGSEDHQGCSVRQASHQGTPISLLLLSGQQSAVHLVVQGGPAEMGGETGFGTLSLFWPVPRTLPEGQAGALLSEEQSFLHAALGGGGHLNQLELITDISAHQPCPGAHGDPNSPSLSCHLRFRRYGPQPRSLL